MNRLEVSLYDKIVGHYSSGPFEAEIAEARKEYEQLVSPIRPEETSEGFILTCLHSWYIFDRALSGMGKTPVQQAWDSGEPRLSEEEKILLQHWMGSMHSLFSIQSIDKDTFTLKELFTREKYVVELGSYRLMLQKNEVIEARIYRFKLKAAGLFSRKDLYHVLPGICVHSAEALPFIAKTAKNIAKNADETKRKNFFMTLQRARLNSVRYNGVKIGAIYNDRPLF